MVYAERLPVPGPADGSVARRVEAGPLTLPTGEYQLTTELASTGHPVDTIQQPLRVLAATAATTGRITVANGVFRAGDRPWHPVGINYWPRLVAGLEPTGFRAGPWSPANYNPSVVEADLARMHELGLTLLSILYDDVDQAGAIRDLLARAWLHGLRVNIYLPGLHPLRPDFVRAETLIRAAQLAQSPALFVYDLGWEVRVGLRSERASWDARWQQWVLDHYGSVETAVADWGYAPPQEAGSLAGATDEQLKRDGPWRTYVAAYRRFWDETISHGYREVRAFLRTLDHHALLGARSGYGGTGAEWIAEHLPFDLASGAKHLDFISPEHYEDSSTEVEFMRGAFTTAYARVVSGGKPVFWSEFGRPVAWKTAPSDYALEPAPAALQRQADYFRGVLAMARRSGANGAAGWWWPGGYRVDERSDFGIVHADLSLRPAAEVLSHAAKHFALPSPPIRTIGELHLDRDLYVTGYAGVYGAHSLRYAEAVLSGTAPRLRTEGSDTHSANTPLVAIGNRPATGRNPPRFLNAEFNQLTLNGIPLRDGATIEANPGEAFIVAGSIGNTAEATWLADAAATPGRVYLAVRWDGGAAEAPIAADTPFLADATVSPFALPARVDARTEFRFRMTARDRTDFGETMRVVVSVRQSVAPAASGPGDVPGTAATADSFAHRSLRPRSE